MTPEDDRKGVHREDHRCRGRPPSGITRTGLRGRYGGTVSPWAIAPLWGLLFVVGGVVAKRRPAVPQREPLVTPPTDLTLRGDSGPGMGEDGRRWRTGAP